MWIRKPKYPVKQNLPKIDHHDQLPQGAVLLAEIPDTLNGCYDTTMFVRNADGLSILDHTTRTLADGSPYYRCAQADFPMEFLSWFAKALSDFQKPPIEGGLPAGAMTSADQNVGGEMLCIQRAMAVNQHGGGYCALNRSRCERRNDVNTEFEPHEVCWGDNFLFEGGLLDLIKDLGEKFEQGKL
jgi:hypothetical protein